MLEFDKKFFEEEERCGFVVSKTMKHVWAAELKVLSVVVEICEKYGLAYYIDYGTLLGAVRHKGYIPWDDDIDLALKRKDYQKLLEVLPEELPEGFCYHSIYNSEKHQSPKTAVTNAISIPMQQSRIEEFYGCPYIVGVDLYALDYIPREKELADAQLSLYIAVYDFAYRYEDIVKDGELEKFLQKMEELCAITFDRKKNIRQQLWQLCDRIGSMFTEEESDELTHMPRRASGDIEFRLKKEWYKPIFLEFENMKLMAPAGYDEVLKKMYGEYVIPKKNVASHDYPFYKKQEAFLQSLK